MSNVSYLVFDADGACVRKGACPEGEMGLMAPEGYTAAAEPAEPSDHGWLLIGGNLVSAPAPPGPTLGERRAARWNDAKEYRERCAAKGCATPLGRVDSDAESQRKISGAVQMAMIAMGAGQPFSIDWTMSDNSVVAHDAAAMMALGIAVGQHVAACQLAGTAIRDAIAASDEPETIDITAGYPV